MYVAPRREQALARAGKATYSGQQKMNRGPARSLLCAYLCFLVACGARTSTVEDEDLLGAEGGAAASAGHPATAGSGGSGAFAGASGMSGGGVSGAGSAAGFGGVSGASGAGGFGAVSGASGAAGFGGVSGASGAGGFGAVSGVSGAGGFGGVSGASGGGFGGISGGGAGGAIVRACVALLASECAPCLCRTCAPALVDCFSDLGCAVIFSCAQEMDCVGAECYSPNRCRAVIDQFGGPRGPSARKVFSLAACSVFSQANCGCN